MLYYHVDVFSSEKLKGNGLTVVFPEKDLSFDEMLSITQEFKQYETIFLYEEADSYKARIFTVEEELNFAGHPILGATAVIHHEFYNELENKKINFKLPLKSLTTESTKKGDYYNVVMNQGTPEFIKVVESKYYEEIAQKLNLSFSDLDDTLPIEVISTGLPYLIIPIKKGLEKCKIIGEDFEEFISQFGAHFAYIFDSEKLECRCWDNMGKNEDVATGSAAGPLCAYLVKHKLKEKEEKIPLKQGTFLNRPSIIKTWQKDIDGSENIFISGEVSIFAKGELYI